MLKLECSQESLANKARNAQKKKKTKDPTIKHAHSIRPYVKDRHPSSKNINSSLYESKGTKSYSNYPNESIISNNMYT